MKTTIIRLSLGFAVYGDLNLSIFGGLSVSCLTGNLLTPDLPVKVPQLTVLNTTFAQAIIDAEQGGIMATANKNTARAALVVALRLNAAYVQSLGLTDLGQIFSTGYEVISTNRTQSQLITPVFTLDNSFTGQVRVLLPAVLNAKSYQVQYSIGAGNWLELGIFPNTRGIMLTALTMTTVCNVRVRAVGGSTQYSAWSATVSAVVN